MIIAHLFLVLFLTASLAILLPLEVVTPYFATTHVALPCIEYEEICFIIHCKLSCVLSVVSCCAIVLVLVIQLQSLGQQIPRVHLPKCWEQP